MLGGARTRAVRPGLAPVPEADLEPATLDPTAPPMSTGFSARLAGRRVAMVTHSYYEEDPRVRREAEALVARGADVDVFALRRPDDGPAGELDGVRIRRLDVQRHQGAGLGVYLAEYVSFLVRAAWALARAHRRRRYGLVQVHTLPDWLVWAALPLRLVGVPILLDLHEAMPEFFRSRFPRAANPIVHRVLLAAERLSIAAATRTITVNASLRARLVDLGVDPERIGVVINAPSLARFDPERQPARTFADGGLRLVYAGALTPTYELDVAVRAMAELATRRPELDVRLELYGRGDSADGLASLAAELGVAERVAFHGRIPIEAVPAAIAAADIGLAPTRRDPFTDASLSTKIFEYGAMRRPVVCSRLPLVEATFGDGTVWAYEPGDPVSLAAAVAAVADDPVARAARVERTLDRVRAHAWETEADRYAAIVAGMLRTPRAAAEAAS